MSKLKHFTYKDAKGKVTERTVYELHPAAKSMLVLDLSEFEDTEREFYLEQLDILDAMYKQEIKELGLNAQYRRFKEANIIESAATDVALVRNLRG